MSKQVIELLACSAIALAAGRWIGRWAHRALYRGVLLTRTSADDRIVLRLAGPLSFLCGVTAWEIAIHLFPLDGDALSFARALGSFGLLFVLAWTGMRAIDSAVDTIAACSPSLTHHRVSQSLLPLARRIAKVAVAVIVAVMVLSDLGYAVGPLVVGLGVIGIAVALAAQKTLENVFGAFAIGVDQPFREGDFIRLDNLVGTVEAIGLRSSRVRTLDQTTVTIPNGKLAEAQVETLTEHDRMRFDLTLKLDLTATAPQLERLLADLRALLFSHPQRGLEMPSVHLVAITDACFELELVAWFDASWAEFEQLRDHLLVRCVDAVAAAGVALHGAAPRPVVAVPRTAPTMKARDRGGLS